MNNGTDPQQQESLSPSIVLAVRVVMLAKEKEVAWMVMPEVLERIKRFCRENSTDDNPEILAECIMKDFTAKTDERSFALLVAIHDGQLIGHLLALREHYCGVNYINVMQFSVDKKSGIPTGILQAGFDMLMEWGNLNMATKVRAQVPSEAHARRLEIFYGFHRKRILMEREI